MTTFGTSAYIKLLALNPQPRDTEIRKRIWSVKKGGYDFHRAMRQIVTEFAAQKVDWATTKARLKRIKKPPERQSATAAAFALIRWVDGRPIRLVDAEETVPSPTGVFSIKFSPDFEIDIDGVATRVHIWNTKWPRVRIREAVGALGHFVSEKLPNSVAVLSLRTNELFVPTDYASASDLARILALDIERRYTRILSERGEADPKWPEIDRRSEASS